MAPLICAERQVGERGTRFGSCPVPSAIALEARVRLRQIRPANIRSYRCSIDSQLRAGKLRAFQVRSLKEHLIL